MIEQDSVKIVFSLGDKIYIIILTAIVTAILGFISNLFHWRRDKSLEAFMAMSAELESILIELEKDVLSYWSRDYSVENESEDVCFEAKIKFRIKLLAKIINLIFKMKRVNKKDDRYIKIKSDLDFVFEKSTGGDFETSKRKASKSIVNAVSSRVVGLRFNILKFAYSR